MAQSSVLLALVFILTFAIQGNCFTFHKLKLGQNDIITPGHGYSTDRQQISPIACYNVRVLPASHANSIVKLDSGLSFQNLQSSLHLDVSAKTKIGIFSSDLSVDYMKSVQDTDFSFSINYYQYIQAQIGIQTGYGPAATLTADGARAYLDGKNPDFGLICGDQFIDSYKAGAMLILGMKLEFHNHADKESFAFHFGASFGSFASLSADIQKSSSKISISGTVTIQAYQVGGNPSELAKILDSKCGPHYCAASCDIQHMDNCITATDGLISYAVNNMPSQVNVAQNKGLSSFPIGFASLVDIKWLGLAIPPSYVNYAVQQARIKLADAFYENKYFIEKFHILLDKYPVPWDKNSTLYKTAKKMSDDVNANMKMLMDSQTGAVSCYSDPQNCVKNSDIIFSKLVHYAGDDFKFLSAVRYKFFIGIMKYGEYFRNGDSDSSWKIAPYAGSNCTFARQVTTPIVNKTMYCYYLALYCNWLQPGEQHYLQAQPPQCLTSTNGITYSGSRKSWDKNGGQVDTYTNVTFALPSDYYFQAYSPNMKPDKIKLN